MVWLYITLTLACIVGVIVVGYQAFDRESAAAWTATAVIALAAVLFGVLASSVTTIDARSVGIETVAGRYVTTLDSGRHYLDPRASVEPWSTRNQTIVFDDGNDSDDSDNYDNENRVTVKLASQGEAYISMTVVWSLGVSTVDTTVAVTDQQKKAIRDLWGQYKGFADMKKSFIKASVQSASSAQFGSYDPLGAIKAIGDGTTEIKATSNTEWTKLMKTDLGQRYADRGITLVSVEVTRVDFDKTTADKLNAYNTEVANTRIATQKVETAKQEALASSERAKQAGQGCEALVRDLAAQDKLKDVAPGVQICTGASNGGVTVQAK